MLWEFRLLYNLHYFVTFIVFTLPSTVFTVTRYVPLARVEKLLPTNAPPSVRTETSAPAGITIAPLIPLTTAVRVVVAASDSSSL